MIKRIVFFVLASYLILSPIHSQTAPSLPKLSMWNRGVFNLYSSDGTTSVGPNWMGNIVPQGAYNSLSLDYSLKDVSWTMTAQWDGDGRLYPIYLRDYSGTFSMFEGLIRFTGGKVWAGDEYRFRNFDTTGFATRIANGETGFLVRVYPIHGFSIGAFVPVPVVEQAASVTYSSMNFGAEWIATPALTFRASFRMEPDAFGNKELALGASVAAIEGVVLTAGYTYRDVSLEHDFFFDASYGATPLTIRFFADLNLIAGVPYYGGKLSAEYAFQEAPFVAGASLSYGNGDVWWNNGLEANPYLRYNFGGSSMQLGAKVACDETLTYDSYSIQLAYTVGF